MMTKLEYLKLAIHSKVIENRSWYFSCFAISIPKKEEDIEDRELYEIVTQPDGLYFVDAVENKKTLVKISDYKRDQPLFSFQDVIEIDSSWLPHVRSKIKTKIGNLIVNALVLFPSFNGKLEYINETIQIPKIEKILAERVKSDTEAKDKDITVSEMVECMNRFSFLTNLANIVNIAATPKAITPPPNISSVKNKLLKEYEGQLGNPVKLVELEKKLRKIDEEYLADDPAAKNIFSKKSKTARQKMFLLFGNTMDFKKSTDVQPITKSLLEGLSTDEKDFPKYMNDLRIGSFSRGSSTQLGGYTYKILQRSLSSLNISPTPCNTKKGLKRLITDDNVSKLVNRYILVSNNWVLIESTEQAKKYLNKVVEIRSSMYCTAPKNNICYKCLSESYKENPTGVTNIASELSSVLLSQFMKLMHGTQTDSVDIDIDHLVT